MSLQLEIALNLYQELIRSLVSDYLREVIFYLSLARTYAPASSCAIPFPVISLPKSATYRASTKANISE
jgi:hypothetical protein